MKFEDLPDILTVEELRKYLRVGRDKAYQLASEIPHIKNGNRMLVPKENVRNWMFGKTDKQRRRLRAVK